ncbi:MAG: hypothetical protein J2P23_12145, partial [Microlunatus sp.]|nr:hypothetical protein [Microlunatus sp.]
MSLRLTVPALTGELLELQPLSLEHVPGLMAAVAGDRSSFGYTLVPRPDEVEAYVSGQLARDGLTPFAQIRRSDG